MLLCPELVHCLEDINGPASLMAYTVDQDGSEIARSWLNQFTGFGDGAPAAGVHEIKDVLQSGIGHVVPSTEHHGLVERVVSGRMDLFSIAVTVAAVGDNNAVDMIGDARTQGR